MFRRYSGIFSALLFAAAFAAAEPYAPMDAQGTAPDKQGNPVKYGHATYDPATAFPNLKAADKEWPAGFKAAFCDLNLPWNRPFVLNEDQLHTKRDLFSARGDYQVVRLEVFVSKPQEKLTVTSMGLRGPVEIPADRIRFFALIPRENNPRFSNTLLLLEPRLENLKAGDRIDLLAFVDVSDATPAGIYRGAFTVSSDGNTQELPVSLRVMDFVLPEPKADFGFYLCGDLYRPAKQTIQQNGFVAENLKRYFDFYRSRRLNSITIYDNHPDLRYVNGKVTGEFKDFQLLSKAMKQAGLNGKLIIDLRGVTYWCNAVAQKLQTLGGKAPAGDLGVTMALRKSLTTPYSESAKKIFAETLRHLLAEAKRQDWQDFLLLVEEEIGNRYPDKLAGYEAFMPVLMEICPECAIVVDNDIGYGRKIVEL